ncbi:hypothetical protein EJB05_20054, partial [Eragrostis curvula]
PKGHRPTPVALLSPVAFHKTGRAAPHCDSGPANDSARSRKQINPFPPLVSSVSSPRPAISATITAAAAAVAADLAEEVRIGSADLLGSQSRLSTRGATLRGFSSLLPHMATSTSLHALSSVRLSSKGSFGFEKRTCYGHSVSVPHHCPNARNLGLVCGSNSQSSVIEPVQLPSSPKSSTIPKKSGESALILIRHGESLWNEKNLFTGCVDVPLTPKGVNEAIEAGKRICNIPVDVIYTSSLIRAQMTAMLAMMQHRRKKVPIIVHNESEQAHRWSEVYSEETKKQSIPVIRAWQLNERMYGELQGLNKQETADRFGKEQVHEWRRSYDIPPPNGESLEMCAERAVAYFKDQIVPQLVAGKHVMIAAHGNSLRSIIMHLDKLTSQEVISLELSTGIPMLYIFKEGKFIRRGSPAGPSEAGVYAYTKNLAQYRQKLDSFVFY